jgi:addiction module RelE/StbE family toxin
MSEKKYALKIARQVSRDLKEIQFYREHNNAYKENTDKLIKDIRVEIRRLGLSPKTAPSLNSKTPIPTNLRYSVVDDYVIVFEIVDDVVNVYRVFYGKQDYLSQLGF